MNGGTIRRGKYSGPQHQWSQIFFGSPERKREEKKTMKKEKEWRMKKEERGKERKKDKKEKYERRCKNQVKDNKFLKKENKSRAEKFKISTRILYGCH